MQWRHTWLNLSLRTKCLLLISFPAAATVAMAGAFYLLGTETRSASQQLNNGRIVANALEELRTSEIEASAHVRGYLITSEEPFAVKARASLAEFDQAWATVSGLTAGNAAQTERMTRIAVLERARVERIFGDTARFRKHTLPVSQLAPAVNAAEDERIRLQRILETMEQANTKKVEATLARLQWLRDQQNTISAVCLFLGLAGGLAMTLLFAQGITGRIARLQSNMTKLGCGESLDALPGWDEIGRLQSGLVRIEHVILQQRVTLDNARDAIAEVDAEGRYRWWNASYANIAGLSEVYRPRSIQTSLPGELRPKLQAAIESMRLSGRTEMTARMEPPGQPWTPVDLTLLAGRGLADAGFYVFLRVAGAGSEEVVLRAQDAAAASNRAKNDFLAKISHDIRTPLNAILGAADLLSQTSLTFDQSGYVHMFQRNCRRLLALINDFLDFSRIEAGAVEIEHAPFQLNEIVGDALATFRDAAAHKGIGLKMEIDPQTPEWLNGDSLRIQQVLVNLLSNALKFTTEGRVEVRAKAWRPAGEHGLRLLCEVVDSGPGIPPQDQDRIFLKFTQLPNQTAGQRGTGLGLTICRDLVGLLGGEIGVSSPAGGGSNFHFTIPIEAAENTREARSEASTAAPALDELATSNETIRILVAEDTEDNRLLVEHYLRPEPVELRFAFNGQEALDAIQRGEKLDLILMDIDMPVMDGYEAARAIRAWESGRGEATPIVALSADAMSEAVRLSLEAGCAAHVSKPIDRATLVSAIQRYARHRSLRAGQAPRTLPVSQEVQALVPQYLASKTKQIAEARDCLTARDFGPIRRFGHNLKGTGSGYGFPDIEDMGRKIERAAIEADIDRIAEQLDALHRFVSETGAAVHPG